MSNDAQRINLENHIKMYAEAGFALFPVVFHDEKKIPQIEGWRKKRPNREINPKAIPTTAFGATLQHDDFIVDYDPRRDETKTQLKEYFARLQMPNPVPTFIVQTGGVDAGYHIYFKKPEDYLIQKGEIFKGSAIEIKSEGNFVVCAGSLHFSGGVYKVFRGSISDIMQVPEALLNDRRKLNQIENSQVSTLGRLPQQSGDGDIATYVRYLTDQQAPQAGNRNETLYRVACVGYDYNLTEQEVLDAILEHYHERCEPPLAMDELRTTISSAGTSRKGKIVRSNDNAFSEASVNDIERETPRPSNNEYVKPAVSIVQQWANEPDWDWTRRNGVDVLAGTNRNLRQLFEVPISNTKPLFGLLRYNEFTGNIEFTKPAPWHKDQKKIPKWTNIEILRIKDFINSNTSILPTTDVVREAVQVVAQNKSYHPIKNYLDSLEWDRVERIDRLMPDYTGAADTIYTQEVGRCTLIALVARIYEPGIQHDHVLILEGKQGSGKTSFCRILGGEWFRNIRLNFQNKDTILNMKGGWVFEMSEMQPTKSADIEELKDFLTRLVDYERPVYERFTEEYPRQCGFIGTVNYGPDKGYLRDTTGNRRFWPVATHKIDLEGLKRDRDQLFAEAKYKYLMKVPHHLTSDNVIALAKVEQQSRVVTDSWADIIQEWLDRIGLDGPKELTTNFVAMNILNLPPGRIDNYTKDRVIKSLKQIGLEQVQTRDCGKRKRVWQKAGYDV